MNIQENAKPIYNFWKYKYDDIYLKRPVYLIGKTINYDGESELNLFHFLILEIKDYYLKNPIKCHYWQYNDNFILPSTIDIRSFVRTPNNFKALENIFQLCGRDNIAEEFSNALSEDGDYFNLLEQVSKQVTKTFQKIWEDFRGTSIQLLPDGNQISIKIVEKAKYNCEDRSEGFKKFISILLMISTQARAKKIFENDLILIDEPDQSLYPTSAQFLRDELLSIANKSKIIYSTHSQYMIDTNNLDRHIIVEKKDDITRLRFEDSNAPYTTDELLKRAIGASIFECLKPINIVFEGYLDKNLFDNYCQWFKCVDEFRNFGKVYLKGVSGVDTIVSILDAANKKFIIVADSDNISISKRGDFEKEHPLYKTNWIAYADGDDSICTMEDFFKVDFLNRELKLIKDDFIYDESKNAIQNIEKVFGKDKDAKQDFKNNLMLKLKKVDVKDSYSNFLDELKKKLNKL